MEHEAVGFAQGFLCALLVREADKSLPLHPALLHQHHVEPEEQSRAGRQSKPNVEKRSKRMVSMQSNQDQLEGKENQNVPLIKK